MFKLNISGIIPNLVVGLLIDKESQVFEDSLGADLPIAIDHSWAGHTVRSLQSETHSVSEEL